MCASNERIQTFINIYKLSTVSNLSEKSSKKFLELLSNTLSRLQVERAKLNCFRNIYTNFNFQQVSLTTKVLVSTFKLEVLT